MPYLPTAPATLRNSAAILGVLRHELTDCRNLLEIGSGTGQHAVHFAACMPDICWQTSDLPENHDGIRAHIANAGLDNVKAPLTLDVRSRSPDTRKYDAVFTANTMHIMSFSAVGKMLPLIAGHLSRCGLFAAYGPFQQGGKFNTESNANFDGSLRARDPEMGIRELEEIDSLAENVSMRRVRTYAMPANNLLLIWQKDAGKKK